MSVCLYDEEDQHCIVVYCVYCSVFDVNLTSRRGKECTEEGRSMKKRIKGCEMKEDKRGVFVTAIKVKSTSNEKLKK